MSAIQNLHSFGKLRKGPVGRKAWVGRRSATGPGNVQGAPGVRKLRRREGVRARRKRGLDPDPGIGS